MNHRLKKLLRPLYYFLLRLGFEPQRIFHLRHYLKYRRHCNEFKKKGGVITHRYPILRDYDDQAGSARGHYFHQDLLVASFVYENKPVRHMDIASRIDGFVAHVAAYRQIDVMDVRDLKTTGHKNISFIKADLMNHDNAQINITDSISCLHAIEHFGLGRYGDPIDPKGHVKGFNNILRMLKPGGIFYVSFPLTNKNEVHFNAHRVFHPREIFSWPYVENSISLMRFDFVDDSGRLHQNINIDTHDLSSNFGCGIYTLKKLK